MLIIIGLARFWVVIIIIIIWANLALRFWAVVPAILADLYGTKWYAAVYSTAKLT